MTESQVTLNWDRRKLEVLRMDFPRCSEVDKVWSSE